MNPHGKPALVTAHVAYAAPAPSAAPIARRAQARLAQEQPLPLSSHGTQRTQRQVTPYQ